MSENRIEAQPKRKEDNQSSNKNLNISSPTLKKEDSKNSKKVIQTKEESKQIKIQQNQRRDEKSE